MYKISASQLDIVQKYKKGEIDKDEVVSIFTTPYTSAKMNIGTSFHSILEQDKSYIAWSNTELNPPIQCGYKFLKPDILKFSEALNLWDYDVHEYKERKLFTVNDEQWLLTVKCDILTVDTVIDIKTTYSAYDYEKYYDSAQWKAYCLAFNVPHFKYQVAVMNLDRKNNIASIISIHHLYRDRSQHSDDDIMELLEVVAYLRQTTDLNFNASQQELEEANINHLLE